jgi:hypothetical protein
VAERGLLPAPITLDSRGNSLVLDRAQLIGSGGEASVFAHPRDRGLVVKLYRSPTDEYARKLAEMVSAPPTLPAGLAEAVRLAWPLEIVRAQDGRFVGYVMPRAEGPRIFEFYNPSTRRAKSPLFHWGRLHLAARNLAAAFGALHARGYVVGDVHESNVIVGHDGSVTMIDTDGFQVPAQQGVFRAQVGRADFTPPELQGVDFGKVERTELHDRFGMAVLIFLTLMEGMHPFAVRLVGDEEAPPLEERIRLGMFPYRPRGSVPYRVPRLAPPFSSLHPGLQKLFSRCFVEGQVEPGQRPSAMEWYHAIQRAGEALVLCPENRQHRYSGHVERCPWCRRRQLLGGRDPYPAPQQDPPAAPYPRPARPASDLSAAEGWIAPVIAILGVLLVLFLIAGLVWGRDEKPTPKPTAETPTTAAAPVLPAIAAEPPPERYDVLEPLNAAEIEAGVAEVRSLYPAMAEWRGDALVVVDVDSSGVVVPGSAFVPNISGNFFDALVELSYRARFTPGEPRRGALVYPLGSGEQE